MSLNYVYIDSRIGIQQTVDDTNNLKFIFQFPLQCSDNEYFKVKAVLVTLPISWTNLNNYNYLLKLTIGVTTYDIIVAPYQASVITFPGRLINAILAATGVTFTCVYDFDSNHITMSAPVSFTIEQGTTMFDLLGLDLDESNITSTFNTPYYYITSNRAVDFTYTKIIQIHGDTFSNQVGINAPEVNVINTIFAIIPVQFNFPNIIYFESKMAVKINSKKLDQVTLKLCDCHGNLLDMDNASWQIVLEIEKVRRKVKLKI